MEKAGVAHLCTYSEKNQYLSLKIKEHLSNIIYNTKAISDEQKMENDQ